MNKCTYCGHENADNAAQCGACGTSLATERNASQPSRAPSENPTRTVADKRMLYGALWCMGGILVTALTYAAASGPGGGTYVIAFGAIIWGAVQFLSGLTDKNKRPNPEDVAYHALEGATRLEVQGRIQEALVVYQKIVESYPDTGAGRDAQKSIENLSAKLQ